MRQKRQTTDSTDCRWREQRTITHQVGLRGKVAALTRKSFQAPKQRIHQEGRQMRALILRKEGRAVTDTWRTSVGHRVIADIARNVRMDVHYADRSAAREVEGGQVQVTDMRIVLRAKTNAQVNRIVDKAPDGV